VENPSNNQDKTYSHVLQKVGVLKNFSVAKVVSRKEIEDLKQLIRAVAKDDAEYEKLFQEEMSQIANMHDPKSPIPGILYVEDKSKVMKALQKAAKDYAAKMKTAKITKKELCYLIASIIKELGLTQDDFLKLNEENEEDEDSE
jgi:flagellar biosynthesis/type III secretory pathway chaperone